MEIFVALYYGGVLDCDPRDPHWERRDRFILSKGHGGVSLYPILADLGFFDRRELSRVGRAGSFLGAIPDILIPGVETINGSLGQGLGVACGLSLALRRKSPELSVFVLVGDGELYEGSVWEAVMFAAHHRLDNLVLIIDSNKKSMLGYCAEILDLPLEEKFRAFAWEADSVDGHDLRGVRPAEQAESGPLRTAESPGRRHGERQGRALSGAGSIVPRQIADRGRGRNGHGGNSMSACDSKSMRDVFLERICAAMQRCDDVFIVSDDFGSRHSTGSAPTSATGSSTSGSPSRTASTLRLVWRWKDTPCSCTALPAS